VKTDPFDVHLQWFARAAGEGQMRSTQGETESETALAESFEAARAARESAKAEGKSGAVPEAEVTVTTPEEPEIVFVKDLSEKPEAVDDEKEQLKKKLADLESRLAESGTVANGFERLTRALDERESARPAAAAAAPLLPAIDWEKEGERLKAGLFSEKPIEVLKDLSEKIARQTIVNELGPAYAAQQSELYDAKEFRLRNDKANGPIYEKYEKEIKRELGTYPANQQRDPRALQQAFDRVTLAHKDDIIKAEVTRQLAEEREKSAAASARGSAVRQVPGGSPAVPTAAKATQLRVTPAMKAYAERMGLPIAEAATRWSELQANATKRRGGT
jgi:hypothetical protein